MQNKSTYLSEIPTDQKSLSERIERNKNMIGKAINHGSVAVTYSDLRARAYDNLKTKVKELEGKVEEARKLIWHEDLELIDCLTVRAQTLVTALEDEKSRPKPEPKIDMKEEYVDPVSIWKDVNSAIKEEPKWLPISCAPKCGSVITVWFLNKWYSLYKEGGNEEVNPEFWLEGSKEEPKTDMKKERVDPEIEIGSHWQSIDGKVITIDFVKNDLVVWTYEFNDREEITLSTNKEIFIKDFKELKRK